MQFDFFTFGGSVFWEDVFFYQKWRIQRNCNTRMYRLLDSWDIRRAYGSFDDCKAAFIKCIENHELTKQQGDMVILLHGYMDGKNIFKPLWRKLVSSNTNVAAINYPSLFKNSLSSAHQLLFFLNHIDDISKISFVTKGAGNLVLNQTLNMPAELQTFRNKMRIGNIVMINPIIKSHLWFDFLYKFKLFRIICGPMLFDLTEKGLRHTPSLPAGLNILHISAPSKLSTLFSKVLKYINFPVESVFPISEDALRIPGLTFKPLNNEKVLNCTVNFINNGKI